MNGPRFVCLFLGAWLATSAVVSLIAFQNHRLVDQTLAHLSPTATAQVKAVGPEQARSLFVSQVNEQNRFYMEIWGTIQVVAGVGFLFIVLFATHEGKATLALAATILLLVVIQRFVLIPEISSLTKLIEVEALAAEAQRLIAFRRIDRVVEGVKLIVGLALAGRLVLQGRRRSRYAGQEVDVIDKAHYGHVNW